MLIAMSQVQVLDGGPDGLVATAAQRGVRGSGNLRSVARPSLVPERELRVFGHALRTRPCWPVAARSGNGSSNAKHGLES